MVFSLLSFRVEGEISLLALDCLANRGRKSEISPKGRNDKGGMAEMRTEEGRHDNRRGFARLEACSRCAIRSFLIPFYPAFGYPPHVVVFSGYPAIF